MNRGEVWWVDLPEPEGSGPGYRRPVLIVQTDSFNKSRISTVIAIAITGNLRLGEAPGNVRVSGRKSGLPKDSVINVSQVITLDKSFLRERIGKLDAGTIAEVEAGLRLILGL